MRESSPTQATHQWILSTNRPYRRVGSLWIFVGVILTVDAIAFYFLCLSSPFSLLRFTSGPSASLFTVLAIYYFVGGAFLRHDSRTIHDDPFPAGSPCNANPAELAYDRCAICGALKCAQELVRIRQSLKFSPGMFGFDGVACLPCAQRRVKRCLVTVLGLEIVSLPLAVALNAATVMSLPAPLAVILIIILAAIVLTLFPLAVWLWRKGWRLVTTPLSTQQLLMTATAERLAEQGTVGDAIRFKRVAALST